MYWFVRVSVWAILKKKKIKVDNNKKKHIVSSLVDTLH